MSGYCSTAGLCGSRSRRSLFAGPEGAGVTPISTATNTAGTRIKVGADPVAIAITPNGATAYVANGTPDTVTPISTATNTRGTPITGFDGPSAIAITLDG
jgi:DNA-binding beta-propeller fold protein YncE